MDLNDPDYQEYTKNVKIKKQNDISENIENIKKRFHTCFQEELKMRRNQLELIENRILKTKKTLHLLRYVLVTSYYKAHEFEANAGDEEIGIDKQSRIHPAIKSLLGQNMEVSSMNTRKKRTKTNIVDGHTITQESDDQSMKLFDSSETSIKQEDEIIPTTSNDLWDSTVMQGIRNRKQVKQRIIIGNISKYMPADGKDDQTTHKWMVYVRTPKESLEISTFVEKVLFYLHPSYKPNDVIELRKAPFHLSRRGWGEFPLRVRIFFKCELNKPVDIIHNLKLDKTCSGRQLLGNETLVDLSLFETDYEEKEGLTTIKNETSLKDYSVIIKHEPSNENESCDYISLDDCKSLGEFIFLEHSYSQSPQKKVDDGREDLLKTVDYMDEMVEQVIKGETKKRLNQESLLQSNPLKKMKLDDKNKTNEIMPIKNYLHDDKYIIEIPKNKFKNCVEALMFLLKRVPLITDLASELIYKCMYPFSAKSLEEYSSWTYSKRASCEWSRAKAIQKKLLTTNIVDQNKWSVKDIILFARSYGYTPLANYKPFNKSGTVLKHIQIIKESYTLSNLMKTEFTLNVDVCVNITGHEEKEKVDPKNSIISKDPECSFVRQAALDVGVVIKPEKLAPNVYYNCAEIVILQAVKCIAEDLIRKARANVVLQGNFDEDTAEINISAVEKALQERPDFAVLKNAKKLLHKY